MDLKAYVAVVGLALLALGAGFLFFRPLPDCSLYFNIIVASGCEKPIKDFGFDPNVFAGALTFASGAVAVIVGLKP